MKILYLAHRIPYPPNKGDKIRTFNEIKYLSESHEIHLACLADNPGDMKYKTDLEKYCEKVKVVSLNTKLAKIKSLLALFTTSPLSVVYFYSRLLQKIINNWVSQSKYDAVICFSSPMAEYLFKSPFFNTAAKSNRPVLIMDFCDIDSEKWGQYAAGSKFPLNLIYKIEKKRLFQYEMLINNLFHYSVVVSQREKDLFYKLYPAAENMAAIPNGVDHEYFSPSAGFNSLKPEQENHGPIIIFTGAMDYYANIEGVTWFCHEIFPDIKKYFTDAQFYIVGSNPSSKIKDLENIDGVNVTGFIDDIRPYYQSADICVVPLRIAAGIQNKVLEAMAMGKPVITTTKALEGIQAVKNEHIMVEDKAHNFSNLVIMLLKDSEQRKLLGLNARNFVRQKFNWKTNMKMLENLCL